MQEAPTELVVGLLAIAAVVWLIARRRTTAAGVRADPPMLVGTLSRGQLQAQPGFAPETARGCLSDTHALATLRADGQDLRVLVFLGTWCPDSVREVPRFLRILEEAGLASVPVELYGLDRGKQGVGELTTRHGIQRVPTFVVLRGDREVGRITERPTVALEIDLAAILAAPRALPDAAYAATTNQEEPR